MPRSIRHIQPVGPRVLVQIVREADVAPSEFYVPSGGEEQTQEALYGEVMAVAREGPGVDVPGIPPGARVLFPKAAGVRVPWDEGLRLLEAKDILAVVDEGPAGAS